MESTSNNWFTNKYPIGYALSGGFIKGFAHLGVMQSLLEHDIKPNILSGVSAGALAGVFYADGNEPHKVLDYFSGHKFQDLTKLVIPKVGLFELGEFIDFLKTNLKAKSMEEHSVPLPRSLVRSREKSRYSQVRDKEISWNQCPGREGLERMLALPCYLHLFIIYQKTSMRNDLPGTRQMLLIWPLLKH